MWTWGRDQERARVAKDVKSTLLANIHRRTEPRSEFICKYDISQAWTESYLKQLLKGLDWTSADTLVNIRTNYLKILSILVYIDWDNWKGFASIFINHRDENGDLSRTDKDLPFDLPELASPYFLGDFFRDFHINQYIFIPVVLKQDDDAQDTVTSYSKEYRMPFLATEDISRATPGNITQELIAREYFQYESGDTNLKERWFARKFIDGRKTSSTKSFQTELDSLKRFRDCLVKNQNIMMSLTTFIHGQDFNIIFPKADLDLQVFFEGDYSDFRLRSESFSPLHLLREAICLVGALSYLHQGLETREGTIACAHMDLKPENIVVAWRPPMTNGPDLPVGQWMIHDFGTSRITKPIAMTTNHVAPKDPMTDTFLTSSQRFPSPFQAPEVQNDPNRILGMESDMWSFGCILAVVLAFALGGPQFVKGFNATRSRDGVDDYFYMTQGKERYVKPQVQQWLQRPLGLAIGEIDHIWIDKCKNLIFETLKISPEERLTASAVREALNRICAEEKAALEVRCHWFSFPPFPAPPPPLQIRKKVAVRAKPSISSHLVPMTQQYGAMGSPSGSSMVQTSLAGSSEYTDTSSNSEVLPLMVRPRFQLSTQTLPPLFMNLEIPTDSAVGASICPSGNRVLFLSKSKAKIYQLNLLGRTNGWIQRRDGNPIKASSNRTSERQIPCEHGYEWTDATLSGTYVVLLARKKKSKEPKIYLYDIPLGAGILARPEPRPVKAYTESPTNVSVSSHGDLLLHFDNELLLSWPQSSEWIPLSVEGSLQAAAFSSSGDWIYGWAIQDQRDYWYIWRAATGHVLKGTSERAKKHEQRGRSQSMIVPFNDGPCFVVCDAHGSVSIIEGGTKTLRTIQLSQHFDGVIAGVITPQDNALVLIQKPPALIPKTNVLVAPLYQENAGSALPNATHFSDLKCGIHPTKSGIAVAEVASEISVVVAGSNGTLERIRLCI